MNWANLLVITIEKECKIYNKWRQLYQLLQTDVLKTLKYNFLVTIFCVELSELKTNIFK